MPLHPPRCFNTSNPQRLLLLIAGLLAWCCVVLGLWYTGRLFETTGFWWSGGFIALQLFAAAQLLLPVLLLQPVKRTRRFYLVWGILLALSIWLLSRLAPDPVWQPLLTVIQSSLLLGVATLVGATMGRYIRHLWEIVPVCLVMSLADLASWFGGPTAEFSRQIQNYYVAPEGPPPAIDMLLLKLSFPGPAGLTPVVGISDWIMAVFFAIVAHRYEINDNLLGPAGGILARQGRIGCYLPVSVAALFVAIMLAQTTGLFIPVLPLMALVVLLWYAVRCRLQQLS